MMRLSGVIPRIVAFFRKGYPAAAPAVGYIPLLALLRRRVTDDEILAIVARLVAGGRGSVDTADVGVEITRITDEMPSPDDVARVQQRLALAERPDESSDRPHLGE
jgi:hypothetical protein